MFLNQEKTKVLLDVVTQGFNELLSLRVKVQSVTFTDTGKILNADIVSKMAACLKIKEIASVIPIDDDFVKEMNPADFSMIQGFLSYRIRKLTNKMKSNMEIDSDLGLMVNSFFDERIAFLYSIKIDLQKMLIEETN
jgi:hypothetical protein